MNSIKLNYFLFLFGLEWNRVHCYWGNYWPIVSAQHDNDDDDDECGAVGVMISRGHWSSRRKYASVPLCPQQIQHNLSWARTRAAALGNRRLTARATLRPNWITAIRVIWDTVSICWDSVVSIPLKGRDYNDALVSLLAFSLEWTDRFSPKFAWASCDFKLSQRYSFFVLILTTKTSNIDNPRNYEMSATWITKQPHGADFFLASQ
jgi:hypothetical protein